MSDRLIAAALTPWYATTLATWFIASRLLLATTPPGCWWNPGIWLWWIPIRRGHWDCV